ncbi:hypothetical protein HKX48_001677 [Thoreauomyces humboldtii]|nr:hypothetical protein HKX48_001677 [Thoreauomyces humboldtii]
MASDSGTQDAVELPPSSSDVNSQPEECIALILSPAERQALLDDAVGHKLKGNAHFQAREYEEAKASYQAALTACPEDENTERAVFYGNMAACHVQSGEYQKAVDACSDALKCNPAYVKALVRRASANERLCTWSSLADALADYKKLLEIDATHKEALAAVRSLPPRIEVAQEKEKAEMMGKLKDLGNSFLGNFGLSLDSFQMKQDAKGGYSVNMKQ